MALRVTENSQQLQPYTRARHQAADFGSAGETIGRAISAVGGAAADYAQAQERNDALYDEAAAKRADAESMREIAAIKGEALGAEGFDAQSAVSEAAKRIEKVRKDRMAALPTPRAQSMFSDAFTRRSASDLADLTTHATRQVGAAHKEASKERAAAASDLAVDSVGTPAFEERLGDALNELPSLFPGAHSDTLTRKRAELTSSIYLRAADAMRTDPDKTLDALDFVDRNADKLLPEDENKIRKALQPAVEEHEVDAGVGQVFEEMGRQGAVVDDDPEAPQPKEATGEDRAARGDKAVSNADPLRGKGRVTQTTAQHMARGGGTGRMAVDIAAPAGTPIYATMSGKVVEKDFKPGGNGYYVKVQYSNGHTASYLHMRGASPLNVGDAVDSSTVLGGVGNSGKSRGNHLDWSVTNAAGNPVDPTNVKWEEGDLPLYTPERNDKADMYAAAHRVATRENWSSRKYKKVLGEIDTMVAREDNLRLRAQQDVEEQVWARVAELGDNFTRVDQVPGFASLTPKEQIAVRNRAEQNKKGTEPEAYGETYLDLLEASTDPRAQGDFASVDLRRVNGITKGERASLMRAQGAIRGKEGKADTELASRHSRIYSTITRLAPEAGYDSKKANQEGTEDRRRRAKLFNRINAQVTARQEQLGRQLNDDEINGIVSAEIIAVTVTKPGALWGTNEKVVPRYLADEVEGATSRKVAVPIADRNRIIAAYQRRHNGAVPPEAEISRRYIQGLSR